jgi:hypothetical protein
MPDLMSQCTTDGVRAWPFSWTLILISDTLEKKTGKNIQDFIAINGKKYYRSLITILLIRITIMI